jgi:hypothetical protein
MWKNNNPVVYADPTGFDVILLAFSLSLTRDERPGPTQHAQNRERQRIGRNCG